MQGFGFANLLLYQPRRAGSEEGRVVSLAIRTFVRSFTGRIRVILEATFCTYLFMLTTCYMMTEFLAVETPQRIWDVWCHPNLEVSCFYV